MSHHNQSKNISLLMRTTALTAVGLIAITGVARADDLTLPVNGNVVAGSSTIGTAVGGFLQIDQHTERTVINWDSFNIGKDATVQFNQLSSSSLAVNRVVGEGQDPTRILGTLRANGNVMVLDRNGVLFGNGAIVDVGGIVASTGNIDDEKFMTAAAGAPVEIKDITGGKIVVEPGATITVADHGMAAFVAQTVVNSGVINARLGMVSLAAGLGSATVDLYGDGLVEFAPSGEAGKILAENSGKINAEGGVVQLSATAAKDVVDQVVNMSGVINASSATVVGGKIILSAPNGKVNVSGTMNAGKNIDVRGKAITIDKGAELIAGTATDSGEVLVIASDTLAFNGYINAVSGHTETSATRSVTVGPSAQVRGSTWLIDPLSITIDDVAGTGVVYNDVLEDALNNNVDVTVATNPVGPSGGNIFVRSLINWTTTAKLTLDAISDMHFFQDAGLVSTAAADITVKAGDDVRFPNASVGAGIVTQGGNITIISGDNTRVKSGNTINANGGNVLINNGGALFADAGTIMTSGTGTITVNQNKTDDEVPEVYAATYSIQGALDAINNSGSGLNTINVGSGTWTENVVVNKNNIQLNGARKGIAGVDHDASDIDATIVNSLNNWSALLNVEDADNVTVDGFDFSGSAGVDINGASDVTIKNNVIDNSTEDGVYINNASGKIDILNNKINSAQYNGIAAYASGYYGYGDRRVMMNSNIDLTIDGNDITSSGSNGIYLSNLRGDANITNNYISDSDQSGINVASSSGYYGYYGYYGSDSRLDTLNIDGNTIVYSNNNGIQLRAPAYVTTVTNNDIFMSGSNGIQVSGQAGYYGYYGYGYGSSDSHFYDLDISGNSIDFSWSNGIYLSDMMGDIRVTNNDVTNTIYGNGIYASNVNKQFYETEVPSMEARIAESEDAPAAVQQLVIADNYIENSGNNGVSLYNVGGDVSIIDNEIYNSGYDGIYAYNNSGYYGGYYGENKRSMSYDGYYGGYYGSQPINLNIANNIIENSDIMIDDSEDMMMTKDYDGYYGYYGYAGIELDISADGYAKISGNTISQNFEYGLLGYSGEIDLTGAGNTIHDTDIGMGFYAGDNRKARYISEEMFEGPNFEYLADLLKLTSNTIGTTKFVDQADGFVDLGFGTFFAPGTPTLMNGNDATYTLGAVTINPESDGSVTAAELATLESMFYHYNDEQDRGLFFFQLAQGGFDQKDAFRTFDPLATPDRGGSLIITGLPRIGGGFAGAGGAGPVNFNDITPAAGDENTDDVPAADVEPSAGGNGGEGADNTACWSDANQKLGSGTAVQMNMGGTSNQLLSDAVACGSSEDI